LLLIYFYLFTDTFAAGGDWTYTGQHGPTHWGSLFRTCAGSSQSPINIETGNVKPEYWKPFVFKNYDDPPTRMRVKNNGHSAQVEMDARAAPRVLNGGLKGEYIFAQFPMELHLVHYKGAYGSLAQAINRQDGLAVLGVMLEVSKTDNPALTPLATALRNITDSGMYAQVHANYPLKAFLPNNLEKFYRYQGSLTTPTCNEVVTWTVFANAIPISEAQLTQFRELHEDPVHYLVNNYRPLQPRETREIYANHRYLPRRVIACTNQTHHLF
ncbi:Carbonic anhydrase 15-like, partial [Homarus americanus]